MPTPSPRQRLLPLAIAAASIVTLVTGAPAEAMRRGSVNQYPVGITMGQPTAALPPAGLYVIDKATYSSAHSVNNSGDETGVSSTTWTNNAQLLWAPGVRVLGADDAMFVRNLGAVNVTLRTPTGATFANTGLPDTEIIPVNLSWKLREHLFFDAELGVYIPDGSYKNAPGRVNIGQHAWTFEPNFSLGWYDQDWLLNAHAVFDINERNDDAGFVGGRRVSYTNGTTLAGDYTAFRRNGRWSYGLVGYSLFQIGSDSGPQALNGGRPKQIAAGVGAQYDFGSLRLLSTLTQDVYARNIGRKGMLMIYLSTKLR